MLAFEDGHVAFAISPWLVGSALNLGVGLLLVAHFCGQYSVHILGHPSLKGVVPLFNMNGELSVPAWFASILLMGCSTLCAFIAAAARRSGSLFARWWGMLALICLYVALDEAVAIHELTIDPLRNAFGIGAGWLYFAWVVPAAIVMAFFLIALIPFLRHLPAWTRNGLLLGGLMIAAGALGVETVGGWYLSTRGDGFVYEMIGGFEELLEFEGIIIILTTLMVHVTREFGPVALSFHVGEYVESPGSNEEAGSV
jgi:hypothetical protein